MAYGSRALVLERRDTPPVLSEIEIAPPGPGEALVRMAAAGLCHTDISAVRDARTTPLVLGHEGVGIIEELGPNVTGLSAGTACILCWKPPCGTCSACARGDVELCPRPLEVPLEHVRRRGRPISRLLGTGCFSERVVLPARALVPLPDATRLEEAALIGCAVATGIGAALRTAAVRAGSAAVVFGLGGVGLNVVVGCSLAQASTIVAVDPDPDRRQLAAVRGATHTAGPEEASELVAEVTAGRGSDYAFEAVGEPAVMRAALATLGRGGNLVLIGAAARDAELDFHPRRFMSMQQRITGCIYGSIRPHFDLPLFISWWCEGKIPLADLVDRAVPLGALPNAFGAETTRGVRTTVSFP